YSEHAFRRRIKGPVEYAVGAVRAVYRRYGEGAADYRPLPQQVLVRRLTAMGQALFAPPNVKGWPGGRTWLNTSTVLERDNFAAALATGALWTAPLPGPTPAAAFPAPRPAEPAAEAPGELPAAFDPARLLREEGASRP